MSTFDDASLVFIPSGYKTSKAYSVKPSDGSGDLTFSRSNDTATRVNSAGLIEKVRTNLILQSQDFTTSWATNASPTITANTTVAPDGTTTADTIASSGASSGVFQAPTVVSGVEYSFSVYVKNITSATSIQIGCDLNPSNGHVYFNAVTGAITFISAGITGSSVTSVGNGWYRVSGTYVTTGTTNTFIVFGQSGMSFAVWGAQLETGVTTAYIATTSAAVSVGPVASVPRLDYLNSSCPRLLLEPQRTNSAQYSEQIDNAFWTKEYATISANVTATLDPSGYNGADKLQEDNTNNSHVFGNNTASATTGQAVSFSIFLKAAERSWAALRLYDGSGSLFGYYNLANGTLGTISAGATGSIVSYGNGWYRCSLTITMASGSVTLPYVFTSTGNGVNSYAGTTGSGIYVWGAQHEIGAYATSYIPTLGAAVTRGADAASKTSASALIGQTEGTLFVEFNTFGFTNFDRFISFTDGSTNRIGLLRNITNDRLYFFVEVNGTLVINAAGIAGTNVLGSHKIAAGYKSGDYVVYMDGVQVYTSSVSSVPATSQVFVGTSEDGLLDNTMSGRISQALVFKTRLTNAQLAELTTI